MSDGHSTGGTEKYLKFAHQNIGYIVDGYEDATVRVGLERDIKQGERVALRSPKDRVFGYAEVEDVYEARVGQAHFDAVFVDDRNVAAHSAEELLENLRRHYSGDVTYDTPVTVIYFRVAELCTPRPLQTATEQSEDGGRNA
jgi:hypothetical protein